MGTHSQSLVRRWLGACSAGRTLPGVWLPRSASAKARALGVALIAGSVAVTVWLGIRSASKEPPTLAESSVYVVFASVLQIAGGVTFAKVGRADPTHARSAVRRLHRMAVGAHSARIIVEQAEGQPAAKQQKALGEISVHLSYIEESAVDAIEDWNEFHRDALAKILGSGEGGSVSGRTN